ncbi:MAG TPA: sensor histidine kinase, partial [Bauldia sp.]|nr:sensor histidine kinase [Bauldia sp.]
MADTAGFQDFAGRSLRLDTLVRLRWLAVAGQTATVLFVHFYLGFPLPLTLCLALTALSALLNVALRLRYPSSLRVGSVAGSLLLGYDVLQLGGLLYLTGGLDNPFSLLLPVPVVVSATTLAPRPTMILSLLVVAVASGLGLVHQPLPWYPGGALTVPSVYSGGVWVALVSTCAFTGVYTFRVADEARQLAKALAATELVLAREQHLS